MRVNGIHDVLVCPISGKLVLLLATDKASMEEILSNNSIKLDEAMIDLGDPIFTGGRCAPGNHNDLTKGNSGSLPQTSKLGQLLLDLTDISDKDSSVAQDPLGPIYLEGINDSEEGLDGFPIHNLEINAEEPIQS
ncbi:hypothetical protein Ancab_017149 [Ancistrocladus abbreviatus]